MTFPAYILRRLLLMIPTLFGITVVCFGVFQIAPGGPVETYLAKVRFAGGGADAGRGSAQGSSGTSSAASKSVTDEVVEELKKRYNFDKPIHVRYWLWLKDVVRFEFGYSHTKGERVVDIIASKLPVSVTFGLSSFFLVYLICIPLGIYKAVRDGSQFDILSGFVLFIAYSIMPAMLGILLIHFFAGGQFFEWFPIQGLTSLDSENWPFWRRTVDFVWHMILPLTCYMIGGFTSLTMLMKNSIIEQIKLDYVRSALARGVSKRAAILKHALRNALLPLATGFGGILTLAFAGSMIIERIFNLDGIGRLSYESTFQRDYPILMAAITITSGLGLLGQLLSDILLRVIDPRIDFSDRD